MSHILLSAIAAVLAVTSLGSAKLNGQNRDNRVSIKDALRNNDSEIKDSESETIENNEYTSEIGNLNESSVSLPKLAKRNANNVNHDPNYNHYTDRDYQDNNVTSPQIIEGDHVQILGKLNTYTSSEQRQYSVGPTDEDWFQITFPYKVRHHFTFTAPNSSYRFSLSKFRGPKTTPKQLEIKWGSSSFTKVLDAGTYFFNFAAETSDGIIPTQLYELKVYNDRPDEPQADVCPPYSDYFKMAIWTNDMVPDNLTGNRYDDSSRQLYFIEDEWSRSGGHLSHTETGYVDPLFTQGVYLDSVIYVWDKQILSTLAQIFNEMPAAIREAMKQKKLNELMVNFVADRFEFWLGQIPIVGKYISAAIETVDTINSILEIANVMIKGADTSDFDNGLALGKLAESCADAAYTSDLQVVCIPRFAQVKHVVLQSLPSGTNYPKEIKSSSAEMWEPHYLDVYYRYKTFDPFDTGNPTYWYDIQRDHSIYHFQTMQILNSRGDAVVSEREYHGSLEVFHTTQEFSNYIGRDYFSEYGHEMPVENPQPTNPPTPVDPDPVFPTVVRSKTTDYVWLNPSNFEYYSGHGQTWYEANIDVPSGILSSEWDSIREEQCEVWSFADVFYTDVYYNGDGNFHIRLLSHDQYTFGSVRVSFKYDAELHLKSLSYTGSYKTHFRIGEPYSNEGFRLIASYTCGYSKTVTDYVVDSSAYNANVRGSYPIRISYTETGITKSFTYTVYVINHDLVSIALSGNYQRTFNTGDEFNYDDLEVIATYANGAIERVTGFTVTTDADMNTPGTYIATVSYRENSITMTQDYFFVVEEFIPTLESIEISGDYQTIFNVGDEFNFEDLVVTAYYENDTSAVLEGFVVELDGDMNTPGTYTVNVSYTENDITKSDSYTITVIAVGATLSSISLSGKYSTVYMVGDELDLSGLVVTAHYFGQPDQVVTDYEIDTTGVNMKRQGTYDITVSYTEGGITKTTTFSIIVLKSISVLDPIGPKDPYYPKDPSFPRDPIIIRP